MRGKASCYTDRYSLGLVLRKLYCGNSLLLRDRTDQQLVSRASATLA